MPTNAWSNAAPAAGDPLGSGDDEIRKFRVDVQERWQNGGVLCGDSTDKDGRHAVNAHGVASPNIYKSDKTAVLVAFSDTLVDMTGATSVTGPNITSGNNPGHSHSGAIAFRFAGALSPGRLAASFRLPARPASGATVWTFDRVTAIVFATPATSTRVDLYVLTAPGAATNRNSAGTSVWAEVAGSMPTITNPNFSDTKTSFTTTTANAGDELVVEVEVSGGASDLSVIVEVH